MGKMNWKKVIGWGVAVLVVIGVIGTNMYQYQKEQKSDKPIVKIGVTLPLTGSMAKMGQDARKAIEMRISEIPSTSKFQYKVIFEDDQLQSSKEFTNAQKLINFNDVNVMISGFSGGAAAIAKLADEKQIIYWNFEWSDTPSKSSAYAFAYILMPHDVAKAWLDEAYKRGYRKLALINNEAHAGGEYIIRAIQELLPNYQDMEIVDVEHVPLFGSDLRTTLLKMNSKKPDIYLSVLLEPTFDEFGKKLKEQNIKTPVSSIDRFEHVKDRSLFNGQWAVGQPEYDKDFIQAYKDKYGEEIDPSLSTYIRDVLDFMVQAYENSGTKPTGKELADYLLGKKEFSGGYGIVRMDKIGVLHVPIITGEIKDGKFIPVTE